MRLFFTLPIGLALATLPANAQENPTTSMTPPPAPTLAPVPSDEPESLETLIQPARPNNPRLFIASDDLETARVRALASRAPGSHPALASEAR